MDLKTKKIIVTVRMSHQDGNYVSISVNLTVTVWNVYVAMFSVNEQKTKTLERKETRSLNYLACKSIAIHSHSPDRAFSLLSIEKRSRTLTNKHIPSNIVITRYSLFACFLSPPLSNSCEYYGFRSASTNSFDNVIVNGRRVFFVYELCDG